MKFSPFLSLFSSRRLTVGLLGAAALWSVAGCASTGGEYAYVTTIATGERMRFPLDRGTPELAKAGTISIRQVGLNRPKAPDTKAVVFEFIFEDTSGVAPKAVRIEDVSEKPVQLLYEDLAPKLEKNFWGAHSEEMTADDPRLTWITFLDDSVRVLRFTITKPDGQEVVLYQAWMVPGFVKAGVRATLGLKH